MISDDAIEWVRQQNWHSNAHPISVSAASEASGQSSPLYEGMMTDFPATRIPLEIEARSAGIRDGDGLLLWFTTGFEVGGQTFSVQYSLGWNYSTVRKIEDFLEPARIDRVQCGIVNYLGALDWQQLAQYAATQSVAYALLPHDPELTDVGYYCQDGELRIKCLIRIADQ